MNNFQIDGFNLSWVPNNNTVDFTFTVNNIPSEMQNNFWAAFAFSLDQNMASIFFSRNLFPKKIKFKITFKSLYILGQR